MTPILGYWKLRGLGQSIRFFLEYIGEAYDQKLYVMGGAPDFDRTNWTNVKYTLGLDLPNIPYYIDGDVKMTQSHTILRYLARKHKTNVGQTEKQVIMNDMLMDQAKDMHMFFAQHCYRTYNDAEATKAYNEKMDLIFKSLSNILGNQQWFTGDKINLADFLLYEELYINVVINSKCLDAYPNLKAFQKRFEDLPAIKKYMSSPKYIKAPINGLSAIFTG